MHTLTCARCGKSFKAVKRHKKYCSANCLHPPKVKCALCDKPAECGGLCHTHDARWRRWGRPPREEWIVAFLEHRLNTCRICGKQWNGYHDSTICSRDCEMERRRRDALERWNAKSDEEKAAMTRRQKVLGRRRRRTKRAEKQCRVCGKTFVGFPYRTMCSRKCRVKYATIAREEIRSRVRAIHAARAATTLEERTRETD